MSRKAAPVDPNRARELAALPDDALVGREDVMLLTGLSQSTVIRGDTRPGYPKPRRLSSACTRYHLGEVRRFIRGDLEATSA